MTKKYLLLLIFLISSSAYAQPSFFVRLGSKPATSTGLITVNSNSQFAVTAKNNTSVYCRYRGSSFNADWDLTTTISCDTDPCPTGNLVGSADGGAENNQENDDAIAFIANQTSLFGINVGAVSGGAASLAVECFETTLYGNFNTVTAANPFNFLELSNDTDISVTSQIVVIKNDGTQLAKSSVTIPAGQQRDIAIHDIAGATNTFGRIIVAHNGPLHGLRASLTKYTSSFVITAAVPFQTRENEQ